MPDDHRVFNRRAITFAVLSVFFFCSIFIFSPLGTFFIWISIGCAVYCAFYSIYNLVLKSGTETQRPNTVKKQTAADRTVREHIRYHLPILVSMFLGALLLVLIFLIFFA